MLDALVLLLYVAAAIVLLVMPFLRGRGDQHFFSEMEEGAAANAGLTDAKPTTGEEGDV